MRAHIAEALQGNQYRRHETGQKAMGILRVTDCKSLYYLVSKRGTAPSERRSLLLDIEALRNDIEEAHRISKWVNRKQILEDCLTKEDKRAGESLWHVLKLGKYQLGEDTMADHRIMLERGQSRGRRQDCLRKKPPYRKPPADQEDMIKGITVFDDAVAEVSLGPTRLRIIVDGDVHGVSLWVSAMGKDVRTPSSRIWWTGAASAKSFAASIFRLAHRARAYTHRHRAAESRLSSRPQNRRRR